MPFYNSLNAQFTVSKFRPKRHRFEQNDNSIREAYMFTNRLEFFKI